MADLEEHGWCCSGRKIPRSEIVYFSQILLIFIVVLASIYNLATNHNDRELWVALLSSCMGYLLPNPKLQ